MMIILGREVRTNGNGGSFKCELSIDEPTVPMNKLLQTKTGDAFPIYVGEGIEVLIEDQLIFLSELRLSGQAAVNIKKRLNK